MAEVQTLPDYPRGLDFQQVWAALQETKQILRENAERFDRQQEETRRQQEKTDLQMKETERILKENALDFNNRLGALTNLFGDMTEHMVAPKLREKFFKIGLDFPRANTNARVNDRVNNISFEVDITLENGDKAMLVEVKTKLTIERINAHIERLEKMRRYADLHGDKRTFLGAVAGIVVTDEVKNYALSQGFYFIEYSGENFYITSPDGNPKEW